MRPRAHPRRLDLALCLAGLALAGCQAASPPPHQEHVVLEGDAYARGLAHGTALRSKIRSFHTTLLTSTLLPYLNREYALIADFLPEYRKARYRDGGFSYAVLLDSALELERSISHDHREELHGVADGAGLAYEDVLILNTFVDTVLSVRAVASAIHLSRAPRVVRVELVGAEADGEDNDEDGEVDEPSEAVMAPLEPSAHASWSKAPRNLKLRFTLWDEEGVDPKTVRLRAGGETFAAPHPALVLAEADEPEGGLEVTFAPPPALLEGDSLVVSINAGDTERSLTEPVHAFFMREERVALALAGSGRSRAEVPNTGVDDGRSQPTSLAFSARDGAAEGGPLLAQSFSLLDANTAHKHTAVFEVRTPEGGRFAWVGWAGIIWGFSGMNDRGLAVACNHSDTLDNQVVARFIEQLGDLDSARLISRGRPLGFALRRILEDRADAEGAAEELVDTVHPFGWNCLAQDASGAQRVVEVDADLSGDGPWVDVPAADRVALGTHFGGNRDDMYELDVAGQRVSPQRYWSSFFYRSVRTLGTLEDALQTAGPLDVAAAEALLSRPDLVDARDSMNAAVYEPASLRFHVASGEVPATSVPFVTFSLAEDAP